MSTRTCRTVIAFMAILWIVQITLPTASAQVTANFSANITSGCSPVIVNFTDLSTGNPDSWLWSFGNGNTSVQQNPGAIYIPAGAYDVCLIVSDSISSDTLCIQDYINVFTDPSPAISADVTQGCVPLTVNFSDNSVPGSASIVQWIWDFGDGNSSLQQNPSHTYTDPGNYSITLSLRDSNNCQSNQTYTSFIQVTSVPKAGFYADKQSSCKPPLTVNFSDSSSSSTALTYYWDFGNGDTSSVQNPSLTYTSLGTFDVSLIIENNVGCADTASQTGYIAIQDLTADFSADKLNACVSETIQFTDLSTSNPSNYLWDFGDGNSSTIQDPTHAYANPGTYTITLISSNSSSCGDTIVKTGYITIDALPQADFDADVYESCTAPLTVNFSDLSTNAVSWLWDFGDGDTSVLQNPNHTFTTVDSFEVSLTVMNSDSCYHTKTVMDFIRITPPKAAFRAPDRGGCTPLEVDFADSSVSAEPIVSWRWYFGDGDSSTMQNPTHIYPNAGGYDVTLIIENSAGCVDTLVDSNYVRAGNKPVADFTANPLTACIYNPVGFSNNTLNSNNWHWDFGDGGTSDQFDPTHTYADTGYFSITLIARDNGCADTLFLEDYIYVSPPDAVFSTDFNCTTPGDVTFTDASLAPDTWFWDFGDGNTSTTPSPSHNYTSSGSYTVSLTVTNTSSGCSDVEQTTVDVTALQADFNVDTTAGCRPFKPVFNNLSTDAVSWRWETAGMVATSSSPNITYTEPGIYDVKLIVTDINGCTDTLTKPNYITVIGPTAEFTATPTTGCKPLIVSFIDSSTSFMGSLISWQWDFDDGDSSVVQNPAHLYSQTGSYDISLTVTDDNGCQYTKVKPDYIQPTYPVPAFSADTFSCTSHGVQFVNNSIGTGMTFFWDFGDSTTSASANPNHTYPNEGIYTVSLTVTDANGCDSTIVKPDYVTVSDPTGEFGADTTFSPCPPLLVNFEDSSSSDVISWKWIFGDGATSTVQNPSHIYTLPGLYDVTLISTTSLGCSDTVFKPGFVQVQGPIGTFNFNPTSECLGYEIEFTASTQNTVYRTWDFGDGSIVSGTDTMVHNYSTQGIYHPVLILDDGLGCIVAIGSDDSVLVGDISADFSVSDRFPCKNEAITFTDGSSAFPAITSWHWNFGDSDTSALTNPIHGYDSSGYNDITLIVSNGLCTDTMTKTSNIYVDPGPLADFTIPSYDGCVPMDGQFQDNTTSDSLIVSWDWDFEDGSSDTVQNPMHTYVNVGTYNVQLAVTTDKGCQDSISKPITVHPLPTANAGNDTTVCKGSIIRLNGSGGTQFNWSPAIGLDSTSASNPKASPDSTINYILTVTDTNNCQNSDAVNVEVYPVPTATAIKDQEICVGETVELWASGGTNYVWSPNAGLTCTTCSNPIAKPDSTITYTVEVVNNYKCSDFEDVKITVRQRPEGITSADTAICKNESVKLVCEGGVSQYWYPTNTLDCSNCPNPVATPDSTTMYTVLMYNQYNCKTYDSVTITINPLPNIRIDAEDICIGDTSQISSSGGVSYSWSPSNGLSCDDCSNPRVFPTQTTTYRLDVVNALSCTNFDTVTVKVASLPEVQTIDDITICNGEGVELTTTYDNMSSFEWSPIIGLDDTSKSSPVASPNTTTDYIITAKNIANCMARDTVAVNVIDKVQLAVNGDTDICIGESATLEGEVIEGSATGTNVVWVPFNGLNDPSDLSQEVSPQQSITYTLLGYSGTCVPDTQEVNITVHPLPTVDAGPKRYVLEEQEVTLAPQTSNNVVSYEWSPNENLTCANCEAPVLTAYDDETYHVTVTDVYGCVNDDEVEVIVTGKCGDDIFVPNTFTPNNDDINDVLYVRGLTIDQLNHFRVYDRWGNKVFETNEINEGWNGIYHGKKLNTSVFVYSLEAVCTNGKIFNKKGNVTLIR